MTHRLVQFLYHLQIKVLLVFSPVTLFHKLSMLSWYSDTLHEWVGQHIKDKKLRVLDVGCASGYLSEHLYRLGQNVSAIDSSKAMIKAARSRVPAVDFKVGDACNLLYTNKSFDIVISASLINIISNPSVLIEQMVRVCKTGGWITVLFPVADFDDDDLHKCISSLGVSGFSEAALVAWHKSAPKISVEYASELLKCDNLLLGEVKFYLNGMIASISAKNEYHFKLLADTQ